MSRTTHKSSKAAISILLAIIVCFSLPQLSLASNQTIWKYQCIDTVKYSRDTARAWTGKQAELTALINTQMQLIKNTGANCVALGTPYDPEFVPFLTEWVNAARSNGLSVWFRGNLSGWEGWFNYPKFSGIDRHNAGISKLVTQNPGMFRDGDIFTPAPEAENGGPGDPRRNQNAADLYRTFLVSSFSNCQKAFAAILKNVTCGYFSANGDVAKDILDKPTIARTGNIVAVDDYVKTAEILGNDLTNLHNKFGTNVVLGEFGVPIPDIHGNLTDAQQANLIDQMMWQVYTQREFVTTINYWDLVGGSAAVVADNDVPKPAYQIISDYYSPGMISGTVTNDIGDKLPNVSLEINGNKLASADEGGNFSLPIPANHNLTIKISANNYSNSSKNISLKPGENIQLNFILKPAKPSLWYQIKRFLINLVH